MTEPFDLEPINEPDINYTAESQEKNLLWNTRLVEDPTSNALTAGFLLMHRDLERLAEAVEALVRVEEARGGW